MGAIGKGCCNPPPPNCESACVAVDPVTIASFSSPENGSIVFTFPTSAVFDCSTQAASDCFFGSWSVVYDQACEQDWPSTDPTAGIAIGQILAENYGITVPTCDCSTSSGYTRYPYKDWYVQQQLAFRYKTWGRFVWKWYLTITPNGTSGNVNVILSLVLAAESVTAVSSGYRTRMKSVTSECTNFVTDPGGLDGVRRTVTAKSGWFTAASISPLPDPPFCFYAGGDPLGGGALLICDESSTPPFEGLCNFSTDTVGIIGNQGCPPSAAYDAVTIRITNTANCNSSPSYPAYDSTSCLVDGVDVGYGSVIRPQNFTGRSIRNFAWSNVVSCSALRSGAITLTLPSPPAGNVSSIQGSLRSPFGSPACTYAATVDAPISASIPTTLSITFA